MIDHVTPFVEAHHPAALHPAGPVGARAQECARDAGSAGRLAARSAESVAGCARGRVKVDLDLKRLDQFGHQLDRASNRLTMGILTASLVVGSSIIMTVKGGPQLFGLPFFGLIGFLIAFFNSVWIIFSIWRSGKALSRRHHAALVASLSAVAARVAN